MTASWFLFGSGCPKNRYLMRDLKLKSGRLLLVSAFCLGAIGVILLLNSCSTERAVVVPLQIEGATYVGDKACIDCHPNISRVFPSSPHARLRLAVANMPGQRDRKSTRLNSSHRT